MGRQQEKLIDKVLEDPAVASLSSFIGVDGTWNAAPNNGKMLINLKPKGERDDIQTVMNRLSENRLRHYRHDTVSATRSGHQHRQPQQPDAIPVHPPDNQPA